MVDHEDSEFVLQIAQMDSTAEIADAVDVTDTPPPRRRRSASRPAGPPELVAQAQHEDEESPEVAVEPDEFTALEQETSSNRSGNFDDSPEPPAVSASEEANEPTPPRRSRRATRGVTTVAFSAIAPVDEPRTVVPSVEAAPLALFQPPDESELAPQTSDDSEGDDSEGSEDAPRRRRRRGGRRRRRPGTGNLDEASAESDENDSDDPNAELADSEESESTDDDTEDVQGDESPDDDDAADSEDTDENGGSRRRRRRRRRAGSGDELEDLSDDDAETVVKVREGRRTSDEITAVRGSARIEAKRQRRRDGREAGRRRTPILTEAEFLARRESVNRVMCVRQFADRTQIAVLEDGILVEHYVNRAESTSMLGNVYLGKVQNVLPSMEAAFVDVGRGRNAVLYAGEVNWDAVGMEGQPKRIELALKSGDPVLVQVTKDPIGHKGARLTSQISLPGRFLVYVPEGSMTGISRKLPDTERSRLKGILKDVVPEGAGVIVRTAAEGATEEQLTSDVQRLTTQWEEIAKKAKSASAPALLYGEPDLAIKVVRDIFNEDFTTLLVQGADTWRTIDDYISRVAPDLRGKVRLWEESGDLYSAHRIDEQLAKALDRKVWLPSGGSLVIDRTEAMTVVDVNTGKFTGHGGNLEETVTKNNLEAAEETVRQLRLRDIGGIIVIDFIDMVLENNRDLVLRRLVECLGRDRTKHQVAEVTSLGLVQMTRKRIGAGLLEAFSTPCEACSGRGHVVHTEPIGTDEPASAEPSGRRERSRRPASASVPLGGKQTGHTPPPPNFEDDMDLDLSSANEMESEAV